MKPFGGIPPTATRISCSAPRWRHRGNATESTREKELARRLSSTYEAWEKRPAADQVPKGLERVKNSEVELPHARRIDTKIAETGQRDQQELATFYLDHARRLFQQESDREAVAELDRALYLSPYLADAHLLLGRIHLRNGRVREAIDALKISLWSAETAEAHAVLADAYIQSKDLAAARVEARACADARSFVERGQTAPRHDKIAVIWPLILRTTASTRSS